METLILSLAAIMLGAFSAAFLVARETELATTTATAMSLTVVAAIILAIL